MIYVMIYFIADILYKPSAIKKQILVFRYFPLRFMLVITASIRKHKANFLFFPSPEVPLSVVTQRQPSMGRIAKFATSTDESSMTYFPGSSGHFKRGWMVLMISENSPFLLFRNLQIPGSCKECLEINYSHFLRECSQIMKRSELA